MQLLVSELQKITDNYISQKVAAIIDIKLERVDIEKLVREAASNLFTGQFGKPDNYNQSYSRMLREEACKLLSERLDLKSLKD